jgi:hypothetical protein
VADAPVVIRCGDAFSAHAGRALLEQVESGRAGGPDDAPDDVDVDGHMDDAAPGR